jgi:hypothetical protein
MPLSAVQALGRVVDLTQKPRRPLKAIDAHPFVAQSSRMDRSTGPFVEVRAAAKSFLLDPSTEPR